MPMLDESKAFEHAGLKVQLFAAGKYKSIGVAGTLLTDKQRTSLQSQVN
jgi:hypothetical protein